MAALPCHYSQWRITGYCSLPDNSPTLIICFLSQSGLPCFTTRKSLFHAGSRWSNFTSAVFVNGFSELLKALKGGRILRIPDAMGISGWLRHITGLHIHEARQAGDEKTWEQILRELSRTSSYFIRLIEV
jgi:hypothetical protein